MKSFRFGHRARKNYARGRARNLDARALYQAIVEEAERQDPSTKAGMLSSLRKLERRHGARLTVAHVFAYCRAVESRVARDE